MPKKSSQNGLAAKLSELAEIIADTEALQATKSQPEDQLKPPVKAIIESLDPKIKVRFESRAVEYGRPDIAVLNSSLLCGFVELKAPGLGSRAKRFKGRDHLQWEKFKSIPNLIYTDGIDWTLYRDEKEIQTVSFSGASEGEAPTDGEVQALGKLLTTFLNWKPIVPSSPKGLAEVLAPLCRLLRSDVEVALAVDGSNITMLYEEMRKYLFPDADKAQFADIYAQTLTYALLLARLTGHGNLTADSAVKTLHSGHGLLSETLKFLTQEGAREEVGVAVEILERVINEVDAKKLGRKGDPWLYFYEDFLEAYDPKLRSNRGVYYTPIQVVQCQVRLAAEILESRFGKKFNFADEGVTFLDPAAGTAAYPLAAINHALTQIEKSHGEGMVAASATECAKNIHAFELLVGPYAVAHLRISQIIAGFGGQVPKDGIHVYLTDTLESPHADIPPQALFTRKLSDEHKRAAKVKKETRIWVCMGNPPYDREQREAGSLEGEHRKGGWVRYGDEEGEKDETPPAPILEDFIQPAQEAGAGIHVKNLYNDYVYFWRWTLWKMFENAQAEGPGIVSFITASSYLRGPGFVGMRQKMREAFDELWILDLEGDNLGARKTENVFAIQTPVAIAIGVRYGDAKPEVPAKVKYCKLVGTKEQKLQKLDTIRKFKDLTWETCFSEWQKPFLPETAGAYFEWPLLTDIFPWQHSGCQFKRTWPISFDAESLEDRWRVLAESPKSGKAALFVETRDRKVSRTYKDFDEKPLTALEKTTASSGCPSILPYGYRSFDPQKAIVDKRLGDYLRKSLWATHGPKQVYMTSLLTGVLGLGPAANVSAHPPDLHHFRGSFGGKDVIALWKDVEGQVANVTAGLLDTLSTELASRARIKPEDLFAYTYAVVACPAYVENFSEELVVPGPRLPLTKTPKLFKQVAEIGKELIWLHTFGERFASDAHGTMPTGTARCTKAVSQTEYPESFSYDEASRTLTVGSGEFRPVSQAIYEFSLSGFNVLHSWLGYRMKDGAGKQSSKLDALRPEQWSAGMTDELLRLIWVLERTLEINLKLQPLVESIATGSCFTAEELPEPSPDERGEPASEEGQPEPELFSS